MYFLHTMNTMYVCKYVGERQKGKDETEEKGRKKE